MWLGRIFKFLGTPLGRMVLLEIIKQVAPDLVPTVSSLRPAQYREWLARTLDRMKEDIVRLDKEEEAEFAAGQLEARADHAGGRKTTRNPASPADEAQKRS